MTPVATRLAERIAAQGPVGVDIFMDEANAHYYATRDPLGAKGDFVTAPEIHQMFGEIVGAALADAWIRAGSPSDAVYAELGPGRGTLAADALRLLRRAGFSGAVHLVESSPLLRGLQKACLPEAQFHDSIAELPPRPLLLVANEFFDALPVKQWVGEVERRVDWSNGQFSLQPDGPVHETSPARDQAAAMLSRHLAAHGGAAIIIDYGFSAGEQGDTLQAVRNHGFASVLDDLGEQDLTAHVDFRALASAARKVGATPSAVVSQGTWLETLGIGTRAMALAAKNPGDTEAIAAARRRLCDEAEMGQLFKVIALTGRDWPSVAGLE